MIVVSSSWGGGRKTLSNSVDDCCKLGTEPNCLKHIIISPGHLLSSTAWTFLPPSTWAGVEKKENPFIDTLWLCSCQIQVLPSCLSGVSLLGDRPWSLKRHWLWPQYKGMCHLLELSLHADNSRYSSGWHSQSTYQMLLDSSTQLSHRRCFWYCLAVGIPLPSAWWHPR